MIYFDLLFCQALCGMTWWWRYSVGTVLFPFWLIMMSLNLTQSVILLLLFSFPDVDALMMSHPCVQHLLGCESFVGFLRASGRCSFHWVDYPMRMWHLCVPALGAKYTLELFLKYRTFPPLSRKCVCWPASWGGVKCPMPFSFWPLEKSPGSKQAHSSALKIRWTTGPVSSLSHLILPKILHFQSMFGLPFSFFSFLCHSSWFNPVRPSHL